MKGAVIDAWPQVRFEAAKAMNASLRMALERFPLDIGGLLR